MDAILTSAIVTYNHQDTIERCIQSVLNQKTSYPFKIEIWDDCSTDKTSRICAEYAERYTDKITHIRQTKNTFLEKTIDKIGNYTNYKNLSTKYFHIIDGDDYLIDETFFQQGIEYLERDEKCSIYATRVRCNDEVRNIAYDTPDMKCHELTITIDDIGSKRYMFALTQGRICRNTFEKECYPVDTGIYLFHLMHGYCKLFNKVSAVYSYNGKGIWSELGTDIQRKLNQAISYRMIQYFGFKHERAWLHRLKHREQRKIIFYKLFLGKKRAWELWFRRLMVPTFGEECLNKYWNYIAFTRKGGNDKV